MRLRVGYPDRDDEVEILARRRRRREDAVGIAPVISRAELGAMQGCLEEVHVAAVTERYIVDLVQATRVRCARGPRRLPARHARPAQAGPRPAALARRDFVLPDDVKAMAVPALAHRLILKPELWAARISATQVVESLLEQVPAPGPESR